MVQMDPTVCGVDVLQNAWIVSADDEVTAALDAVMDCVDVSAGVAPSTAPVAVGVNEVQCLFGTDVEFTDCGHCHKYRKGN
jgi:hypothetical protein